MRKGSPVTAPIPPSMARFPTLFNDPSRVRWSSCDFNLRQHRPDPGVRNGRLGVCAGRRRRHLLDRVPERQTRTGSRRNLGPGP